MEVEIVVALVCLSLWFLCTCISDVLQSKFNKSVIEWMELVGKHINEIEEKLRKQ